MIELKKGRLPEAVEVDGEFYAVRTSFKFWLRFLELSADKGARLTDFDFIYAGRIPQDRAKGLSALVRFCTPPEPLPRGAEGGGKVVDYRADAGYIYAAFMEMYGIDLVESDMHWYKFQSLFRALHGTKLNEIIGYRLYESNGRRDGYAREMERLKRAWALPDDDDGVDEDLEEFQSRIGGGNRDGRDERGD